MSRKENNAARELEQVRQAILEARMKEERDITMQVTIAWMQDVAVMAAHNCWGIGKGRMGAFIDEMNSVLQGMCEVADDDISNNNDKHFVYTKAKVDEVIKSLVPEDYFRPWEVRYHSRKYLPGEEEY